MAHGDTYPIPLTLKAPPPITPERVEVVTHYEVEWFHDLGVAAHEAAKATREIARVFDSMRESMEQQFLFGRGVRPSPALKGRYLSRWYRRKMKHARRAVRITLRGCCDQMREASASERAWWFTPERVKAARYRRHYFRHGLRLEGKAPIYPAHLRMQWRAEMLDDMALGRAIGQSLGDSLGQLTRREINWQSPFMAPSIR